jgi:hypothetical protein
MTKEQYEERKAQISSFYTKISVLGLLIVIAGPFLLPQVIGPRPAAMVSVLGYAAMLGAALGYVFQGYALTRRYERSGGTVSHFPVKSLAVLGVTIVVGLAVFPIISRIAERNADEVSSLPENRGGVVGPRLEKIRAAREREQAAENRQAAKVAKTKAFIDQYASPGDETVVYALADTTALTEPRAGAEAVLRVQRGDKLRVDRRSGQWIAVLTEYDVDAWLPAEAVREAVEAAPHGVRIAADGDEAAARLDKALKRSADPRWAEVSAEFVGLRTGLGVRVELRDGATPTDGELLDHCDRVWDTHSIAVDDWPFRTLIDGGSVQHDCDH